MQPFASLFADPAAGPLDIHQAAGWLLRLAKNLDALHAQNRAHGALSERVVLVEERSPFERGTLLSDDGQVSLPHRSPERGAAGPPSAADDRWAWAVLLHQAVTGGLPDPAHELPGLSAHPALQAFLRRCFAPSLSDRPASAAALGDAMERIIGAGNALGPLETEPTPGQVAPKHGGFGGGRGLLVVAAGLSLLVVVSFAALRQTADKLNAPTPPPDLPAELPAPSASAALPVPALSLDAPELRGAVPVEQCVERMVGAGIADPQAAFCTPRDALVLVETIRGAVKGKPAQKKWDALGWYDLPAAVAAQARCCPLVFAPTLDTPPSCATDAALASVQAVARRKPSVAPGDPALLAAAKTYGEAAVCSSKRFSDTKKAHRPAVGPGEEAAFLATFAGP